MTYIFAALANFWARARAASPCCASRTWNRMRDLLEAARAAAERAYCATIPEAAQRHRAALAGKKKRIPAGITDGYSIPFNSGSSRLDVLVYPAKFCWVR